MASTKTSVTAAKRIMATKPLEIFGVQIDQCTQQLVHDKIARYLKGRGWHHLITPNTEMVVRARRDPQFRALINQATLRLPDGIGLIWFSRWILRNQAIQAVHGADVVEDVFSMAREQGKQVLLIGNKAGLNPRSAEEAAQRVTERYPGLHIAGLSINADSTSHQIELIHHIDPHVVMVGLGAPSQDYWLRDHRSDLKHAQVVIGVGATIDYLSGTQKRAPGWMQRLELEWLWRLILQPKRIGRQMAIPYFMWLMLLVKLKLIPNKPLR